MGKRALFLSTIGALVGAAFVGLLGSGVMDALTGSGTPNPGGAVGSVVGAFAGGYLTLRLGHPKPR